MDTSITLDERHFRAAVARARERGITPGAYVQSLIEQAGGGFERKVAPIRKSIGTLSEEEIEELFERAAKHTQAAPRT